MEVGWLEKFTKILGVGVENTKSMLVSLGIFSSILDLSPAAGRRWKYSDSTTLL
jgi:hypothetical protein